MIKTYQSLRDRIRRSEGLRRAEARCRQGAVNTEGVLQCTSSAQLKPPTCTPAARLGSCPFGLNLLFFQAFVFSPPGPHASCTQMFQESWLRRTQHLCACACPDSGFGVSVRRCVLLVFSGCCFLFYRQAVGPLAVFKALGASSLASAALWRVVNRDLDKANETSSVPRPASKHP